MDRHFDRQVWADVGQRIRALVPGRATSGSRARPFRFSGYAGMDVGCDNGLPADRAYADKSPFAFTGTIRKVVFEVNPHLTEEEHAMHEHAQHGALAHGALAHGALAHGALAHGALAHGAGA